MRWQQRVAILFERYCGVRLVVAHAELRLERAVLDRMASLGIESGEAYVAHLEHTALRELELARLGDALTIGHTSFFRDAEQLESAVRTAAPTAGRPLTIWSAGCSTGQEPYSLAILAAELGIPVEILGTDLNAHFLAHARQGVYGEDQIARLAPARRLQFSPHDAGMRIHEPLARRVRFERHNLLAPSQPTPASGRGWDLILCRNVFIYFGRPTVASVATRLVGSLAPEGKLVLGAADPYCGTFPGIAVVESDGRIFYRAPDAVEVPRSPPRLGHAETSERPPDAADRALARLSAGNALLATHDFAGALRLYDEVAQEAPLLAEVHYLRGLVLRKQGDYAGAKAALRSALFVDADFWPAAYLLGSCLEREGDAARAHREFAHAVAVLDRRPDENPVRSVSAGAPGVVLVPHETLAACRRRLVTD